MGQGGVLILVLEQPRLKEWIAATRGVSMAYSRSKAWYMVVRKLERVTEKNANTDAVVNFRLSWHGNGTYSIPVCLCRHNKVFSQIPTKRSKRRSSAIPKIKLVH